ncbi:hypothetical protein, variant [Capsaspora owczarzaki ATCC 30864]|uniref:Uncharacterized protein n=1 Tax=Capsaspora owczarzaki (strain ATCC 30864) TaxID=595528 RepID=A0A0D2U433_CAPO3|nr:hypothetical protein, variant [Capsaspora owczarzaki ATCC 30864]
MSAVKQLNDGPSSNRYRFQSFNERIKKVSINVAHRVGAVAVEPEAGGSFFNEALMKWRELDCTREFVTFTNKVYPLVQTLHQLLFHKDAVIDALLVHLAEPNCAALPALLDLLAQLARDLREEFYPDFPRSFVIVARVLEEANDPPVIEAAFTALSYLFKFLLRYLIRDMRDVFRLYRHLLASDVRPYIRAFAAESFALLLRKVPANAFHNSVGLLLNLALCQDDEITADTTTASQQPAASSDISGTTQSTLAADYAPWVSEYSRTVKPEGMVEGMSLLIFETVRGVQHQFHSRAREILSTILDILLEFITHYGDSHPISEHVGEIVQAASKHMANFTTPEYAGTIIDCVVARLERTRLASRPSGDDAMQMEDGGSSDGAQDDAHCFALLRVLSEWIEYRGADRIQEPLVVLSALSALLQHSSSLHMRDEMLELLVESIRHILLARISATSGRTQTKKTASLNAQLSARFGKDRVSSMDSMSSSGSSSSSAAASRAQLVALLGEVTVLLPALADSMLNCLPFHLATALLPPFLDVPNCARIFLPRALTFASRHYTLHTLPSMLFARDIIARLDGISDSQLASSGVVASIHRTLKFPEISAETPFAAALMALIETSSKKLKAGLTKGKTTTSTFVGHTELATAIASVHLGFALLVRIDGAALLLPRMLPVLAVLDELARTVLVPQSTAQSQVLSALAAGWTLALPFLAAQTQRLQQHGRTPFTLLENFAHHLDILECVDKWFGALSEAASSPSAVSVPATHASKSKPSQQPLQVDFINATTGLLTLSTLNELLTLLVPNLSSPYSCIRAATLVLLTRCEQLPLLAIDSDTADERANPRSCLVFSHLLQAEQTPADLENFRTRLMHVRQVDTVVVAGRLPTVYIEPVLRCHLATLYLNFKPLWAPAMEMIGNMASRIPEAQFWQQFFSTFEASHSRVRASTYLTLLQGDDLNAEEAEDDDEMDESDEKQAADDAVARSAFIEAVETARASERPDHVNFHVLLLQLAATDAVMPFIERHGRELLPLFFDFIDTEYNKMYEGKGAHQDLRSLSDDADAADDDQEEDAEDASNAAVAEAEPAADDAESAAATAAAGAAAAAGTTDISANNKPLRALVGKKLGGFLGILAKLRNPKAAYQSDRLLALLLELLAKPEAALQAKALQCILAFKFPYLTPYREPLEQLCGEQSFRSALLALDMDADAGLVKKEHRQGLLSVMSRLLYAKMISRAGGRKQTLSSKRSAVLGYLMSLSEEEIAPFIDLSLVRGFSSTTGDDDDGGGSLDPARVVPLRKQLGFLTVVFEIIQKLGVLALPYVDVCFAVVLNLTANASTLLQSHAVTSISPAFLTPLKSIRLMGLRRLSELFRAFADHNFNFGLPMLFSAVVNPRLPRFQQETAQSSSGLLDLFVVWSQHPELALYLARNVQYGSNLRAVQSSEATSAMDTTTAATDSTEALPILIAVFNCLSNPSITHQVAGSVLDLAGNVVALLETHPAIANEVLLPHVGCLLQNLQLATSVQRKHTGQTLSQQLVRRNLQLLAKLSHLTTDPEQCRVLVCLLLPFLKKRSVGSVATQSARVSILGIVEQSIPLLPMTSAFYAYLSQLFATLEGREPRTLLCRVFAAIAAHHDPSVQLTADLLARLNAYLPDALDEMDYDTRLVAFAELNDSVAGNLTCHQLLPLAHCYVHFLHADDFGIRDNASYGLLQLIRRVHLANAKHAAGLIFDEIILQIIVPAIKIGVRVAQDAVRNEVVGLLRALVEKFPTHPQFADMTRCGRAAFFVNICHVQLHRRARAMRILARCADEGRLAQSSIVHYFLPLISHVVIETTRSSDHNIVTEAIRTVAMLARQLSWSHYYKAFQSALRTLKKNSELQTTIVRLLVAIIESFHFDLQPSEADILLSAQEEVIEQGGEEADAKDKSAENVVEAEDDEDDDEGADEEGQDEPAAMATADSLEARIAAADKMKQAVLSRLLPSLHNVLVTKKGDTEHVRSPVAIAIVSLLMRLPRALLDARISGVIARVCNLLKSHNQQARDEARATLGEMLQTVGAEFLPVFLRNLQNALARGYQLHILGFTLHAVLSRVLALHTANPVPASQEAVDSCAPDIVRIILDDTFGEVGKEKEVQGITAKSKEARSRRGGECMELLCRLISFKFFPSVVLSPMSSLLEAINSVSDKSRIEELLRRAASGLTVNPSVQIPMLLICVYSLLERSVEQLRAAVGLAEQPFSSLSRLDIAFMVLPAVRRDRAPSAETIANAHVLVEFGLVLLRAFFKRDLDALYVETLQMLDPLVRILCDCLVSRHSRVLSLSLKCLSFMYSLPLPTMSAMLHVVVERVLRCISRAGQGSQASELVQSCMRAVIALILRKPAPGSRSTESLLQEKQLTALLALAKEGIEAGDHDRQTTTFALIRAIVTKKLVSTQLVDVIEHVADVSVRSQFVHVRQACSHLLVAFILDHPTGQRVKVRTQFIQFLVNNLGYEYQTGRESVIETIHTFLLKAPAALIPEVCEYLFLALAPRLVNDEAAICREMCMTVVRTLVARCAQTAPDKEEALFNLTMQWLGSTKESMRRMSAQMAGAFVSGTQPDARVQLVIARLVECVSLADWQRQQRERRLAARRSNDDDDNDAAEAEQADDEHQVEAAEAQWQLVYMALSTLSKLIQAMPRIAEWRESTPLWEVMPARLLHSHSWVRLAAARLWGLACSKLDTPAAAAAAPVNKLANHALAVYLTGHGNAVRIAHSLCRQMASRILDNALAEQIVKNLFFVSKLLLLCPPLNASSEAVLGDAPDPDAATAVDSDYEETADIQETIQDRDGQTISVEDAREKYCGLTWMFRSLAFTTRVEYTKNPRNIVQRSHILKWFAAMAATLGPHLVIPFLDIMLSPVYRIVTDDSGTKNESLITLGNEVVDLLQQVVGPTRFHQTYNAVRTQVQNVRSDRKRNRVIQAVVDPAAAARRKIKKNLGKREARRNKIAAFKPDLQLRRTNKRVRLDNDQDFD